MVEPNREHPLDFEIPIFEMEAKIRELEELSRSTGMDLNGQMVPLKAKLQQLTKEIFARLGAWEKVQLARHVKRPYTSDYIHLVFDEFVELHGDRAFADDPAMACGLARIDGRQVMVLGQRKGRDLKEKIACNFGCAHPEGYRKAHRIMRLAEKFGLPIVTFINTPGAYPGIGAEERGQAWAIAENLMLMANLKVPVICFVIGEGGSGGALGIGIGDRVFILEHAYYSVISPEGCAAILWKSAGEARRAAEALRLTATDLLGLGVVDEIVPEPLGGAHRHPEEMAAAVKDLIRTELDRLGEISIEELMASRYAKFRAIGSLFGDEPPRAPVVAVAETSEAPAGGEDDKEPGADAEGA
ncbi:MAG: acetyl-CoA carboxylase carboxyltransferase subunit alpha [Planctomycetes bacterium]|nr:acetyl-CoA carboxylase carboxyltransferase subunit alpha [Planctomycetota bacterium]